MLFVFSQEKNSLTKTQRAQFSGSMDTITKLLFVIAFLNCVYRCSALNETVELTPEDDVFSAFDNAGDEVMVSTKNETSPDSEMTVTNEFTNSLFDLLHFASEYKKEQLTKLEKDRSSSDNSTAAEEIWISYARVMRKLINAFILNNIQRLVEDSNKMDLSSDCSNSLLSSITSLREMKSWIFEMIDSSGSPFSHGLLSGTITNFGSFDQCLAVKSPPDDLTGKPTAGQYCIVKYTLPLPPKPKKLTLQTKLFNFTGTEWQGTLLDTINKFSTVFYERYGRFGICVPSTCTKRDIQQILDFETAGEHIKNTVADCTVMEKMKFTVTQTLIIALLAVIAVLLAVGTLAEAVSSEDSKSESTEECLSVKKSCLMRVILCFSVITNGRTLFSTATHSHSLEAINGVKALSMAWILLTHTYLIPIKETFAFARSFMEAVENITFQLILNGWVLVDSFFIAGALLVTYSQCRVMQKMSKVNYVQMILHRFLRLSPMVWFTILLMLIVPKLGSGPLWNEYFDRQEAKCKQYWWSTVLYINNWFTEDKMCLLHTWYLSADFQMYLLSLLFMYPMLRRPKLAVSLIGCTVLGSIVSTAIMTYLRSGAPTVIYNTPSEVEVYKEATTVYTPTISHVGPYFIGVFLGFVVFKRRHANIRLWIVICCWIVAIISIFIVLLSTWIWNSGGTWSPLTASLYAALHRVIWASAVGWVCFACLTGNGGPINSFLSWKVFHPLSRMSLSIYLMHFLVIWARFAYLREVLPFSHYTLFCEFLVNYTLSILMAIIVYVAIEAPFDRLMRSCLSQAKLFSCFALNVKESKANSTSVPQIKYLNESIIYKL